MDEKRRLVIRIDFFGEKLRNEKSTFLFFFFAASGATAL